MRLRRDKHECRRIASSGIESLQTSIIIMVLHCKTRVIKAYEVSKDVFCLIATGRAANFLGSKRIKKNVSYQDLPPAPRLRGAVGRRTSFQLHPA